MQQHTPPPNWMLDAGAVSARTATVQWRTTERVLLVKLRGGLYCVH